jgi:hypothetical protein
VRRREENLEKRRVRSDFSREESRKSGHSSATADTHFPYAITFAPWHSPAFVGCVGAITGGQERPSQEGPHLIFAFTIRKVAAAIALCAPASQTAKCGQTSDEGGNSRGFGHGCDVGYTDCDWKGGRRGPAVVSTTHEKRVVAG